MSIFLFTVILFYFLYRYSLSYVGYSSIKNLYSMILFLFLTIIRLSIGTYPIESILLYPFFYLAFYVDEECGEIPDLCSIGIICISIFFKRTHLFSLIIVFSIGSILSYFKLIGFGDIKLFSAMAFFIGEKIIYVIFGSSYIGLFYYFIKKKERIFPFAPSIVCSFILLDYLLLLKVI